MNLRGKSREQVEKAFAGKSRSEILDAVYSLCTLEELFRPSQIAARTHVHKRAILRDIRDGKFGAYYCRADNSILVPASGVQLWLARYKVSVSENK